MCKTRSVLARAHHKCEPPVLPTAQADATGDAVAGLPGSQPVGMITMTFFDKRPDAAMLAQYVAAIKKLAPGGQGAGRSHTGRRVQGCWRLHSRLAAVVIASSSSPYLVPVLAPACHRRHCRVRDALGRRRLGGAGDRWAALPSAAAHGHAMVHAPAAQRMSWRDAALASAPALCLLLLPRCSGKREGGRGHGDPGSPRRPALGGAAGHERAARHHLAGGPGAWSRVLRGSGWDWRLALQKPLRHALVRALGIHSTLCHP